MTDLIKQTNNNGILRNSVSHVTADRFDFIYRILLVYINRRRHILESRDNNMAKEVCSINGKK